MLKEHYMVGLVFAFMRIVFPFVVVHQLFTTSWTTACQAPLSPLSLRVCSNSCPLSQWCYLTISSSTTSFFLCLQYFPASGSFPMSWLFASGCQNTGASALASVLSVNIQGWFPLRLTDWSPCSSRDSRESSPAPQFKSINSSAFSLLYGLTLTSVHDYWKNQNIVFTSQKKSVQ